MADEDARRQSLHEQQIVKLVRKIAELHEQGATLPGKSVAALESCVEAEQADTPKIEEFCVEADAPIKIEDLRLDLPHLHEENECALKIPMVLQAAGVQDGLIALAKQQDEQAGYQEELLRIRELLQIQKDCLYAMLRTIDDNNVMETDEMFGPAKGLDGSFSEFELRDGITTAARPVTGGFTNLCQNKDADAQLCCTFVSAAEDAAQTDSAQGEAMDLKGLGLKSKAPNVTDIQNEESDILARMHALKTKIQKLDLRSPLTGMPLKQRDDLRSQLAKERERLAEVSAEIMGLVSGTSDQTDQAGPANDEKPTLVTQTSAPAKLTVERPESPETADQSALPAVAEIIDPQAACEEGRMMRLIKDSAQREALLRVLAQAAIDVQCKLEGNVVALAERLWNESAGPRTSCLEGDVDALLNRLGETAVKPIISLALHIDQ